MCPANHCFRPFVALVAMGEKRLSGDTQKRAKENLSGQHKPSVMGQIGLPPVH
jgi:hypothetical protein